MSSQCTCTTDKEATCIVHPTTRSLKEHIAELEAEVERLRELVTDLWVLDTDSLVEALEAGNE